MFAPEVSNCSGRNLQGIVRGMFPFVLTSISALPGLIPSAGNLRFKASNRLLRYLANFSIASESSSSSVNHCLYTFNPVADDLLKICKIKTGSFVLKV